MNRSYLAAHRAHDYAFLTQRWRAVAQRAGLVMRAFAAASGFKVFVIRSKKLPPDETSANNKSGIYISAGIHGDEPAGTEALITWAEKNVRILTRFSFFIAPCLNPWGLIHNSRVDADGRDLNRVFHHDDSEVIAKLKLHVRPHRFALGVMLHEDYDGQGVYIYEIENATPFWGDDLLKIASRFLPIEGRALIDGREHINGVVRRKIQMRLFKKMGLPEAAYLHMHHAQRVFTIETPSEFALEARVNAHVAMLDECVRRALNF